MRCCIFSDIHSNLEAFEAVISCCAKANIDRYFCAGDIVGYAASPKECIKIVQDLNGVIIAGNHDWASVGEFDIGYFNHNAKNAIIWTRDRLDVQEQYFLKSLKLTYECNEFTIVHGTLDNPNEFKYMLDARSARKTFDLMSGNLCFIAHTHIPGIFVQDKGSISYLETSNINISADSKYIINVGSVGQPRDRDSRAAYCIYDTDSNSIEIKRVAYDIRKAQVKIIDAGLPLFLATRLTLGR